MWVAINGTACWTPFHVTLTSGGVERKKESSVEIFLE